MNAPLTRRATKTFYVLGFLLDGDCENVILLRKRRPSWRLGYLNGIGGKVEPDEHMHDAMLREGSEEAAVAPIWTHYISLEYPEAYLACHHARDQRWFDRAVAMEDEPLERVCVAQLHSLQVIPNLRFLVPLAVHAATRETPIPVTIPFTFGGTVVSQPDLSAAMP